MSESGGQLLKGVGTAMACVAMAVVGWSVGGMSDGGEGGGVGPATKSGNREGMAAHGERRAAARGHVRGISQLSSLDDRMRSSIELAMTIPVEDIGEWLEGGWFGYRDGFELTLFRKVAAERWRMEDPAGFVAWCLEEGEYGGVSATGTPRTAAIPVLMDWAVSDPDQLQEFFNKHPNDDLEAELISKLVKTDPVVARERLMEMVGRGTRNDYRLNRAVAELVRAAPAEMEAILDDLPESVRMQAETSLVGVRLKDDFDATFQNLLVRPDGWLLFSANIGQVEGMGEKLLEVLPDLPASWRTSMASGSMYSLFYNTDSSPWVLADLEGAGFSEREASRFRNYAMQGLASRYPEKALGLLSADGVDEKTRASVISSVFRRGRVDEETRTKWLGMLTSEEDREAAQTAMEGVSQRVERTTVYAEPGGLLAAFRGEVGEDVSVSAYDFSNTLRRWDGEKQAEFAKKFEEMSVEEKSQVTNLLVSPSNSYLSYVPRELRGDMIRHSIEHPQPVEEGGSRRDPGVKLASRMAVEWVADDPRAATEWVGRLPDGEAKLWAQKNLAAEWGKYDPERMEAWVGALPAESRAAVREHLDQ